MPSGLRIVLFLGKLGPSRGLETAEAAVSSIEDAALVLIGFGDWQSRIASRDTDERFAGRHFTLPAVPPDEVPRWAASADVSLIPVSALSLNHRYSTPNKLWESIAGGMPAVVSRELEVMAELVQREGLGATFEGSGGAAMAGGLRAVLDLPEDENAHNCDSGSWPRRASATTGMPRCSRTWRSSRGWCRNGRSPRDFDRRRAGSGSSPAPARGPTALKPPAAARTTSGARSCWSTTRCARIPARTASPGRWPPPAGTRRWSARPTTASPPRNGCRLPTGPSPRTTRRPRPSRRPGRSATWRLLRLAPSGQLAGFLHGAKRRGPMHRIPLIGGLARALGWPLAARAWGHTLRDLPPADLYHASGIGAGVVARDLARRAKRRGRAGRVVYDYIDIVQDSELSRRTHAGAGPSSRGSNGRSCVPPMR